MPVFKKKDMFVCLHLYVLYVQIHVFGKPFSHSKHFREKTMPEWEGPTVPPKSSAVSCQNLSPIMLTVT